MTSGKGTFSSLIDALFLDIPYIVDSVARRAEYKLNRLHLPHKLPNRPLKHYLARPSFVLLFVVLVFAAYGPTFSSLCSLIGGSAIEYAQATVGWLCIFLAVLQLGAGAYYFLGRIKLRFERQQITSTVRKLIVRLVFALLLLLSAAPLAGLGIALLDSGNDGCQASQVYWPSVIQLVALILTLGIVAWRLVLARSIRSRLSWQAVAIATLVFVVFNIPGASIEAAQTPYEHVFGYAAVWIAFTAWSASWLICIPFRSLSDGERQEAQHALREVELFPGSREDPELSPRRIIGGLVIGILQKPFQFFLLPAFAVLLVPEGFLWHALVVGVTASSLLIIASTLTSRWDRLTQYLRRYLLTGIPFVVSAAVIGIAVLRVYGVQYVTTLLNIAPFGVLFSWMMMAYVLGWWFEYQASSVLAAQLLRAMGGQAQGDDQMVPYDPSSVQNKDLARIDRAHRYITGHGMGGLVVIGQISGRSSSANVAAFHAYSFQEFFDKLLMNKHSKLLHEITRRIQLYFALVNLLLLVGVSLYFWYWGRDDRLNTVAAVVTAHLQTDSQQSGAMDLSEMLRQDAANTLPPAVIVSASGGGTRAALYTTFVLEGLHRLGAASDIVLLSGVSGGGVASAYFYGHRDALLQNRADSCELQEGIQQTAWACYRERMAMPFINDVLRGASEWRVQSEQPLGVLLAESFERRLFTRDQHLLQLGDSSDVGLILNSTITGLPLQETPMLNGAFMPLANTDDSRCQDRERPSSAAAGGRLAFSNLQHIEAFLRNRKALPGIFMPFVMVRDPTVGLAQAAALNANFPPVFPNARVNIEGYAQGDAEACDVRSYYVTDGGATENLGLISALLALHSALDAMGDLQNVKLRDIDIVLAEASALDYDYSQDRGVGAATGGSKERLTGRLTLELLVRLEQRVGPNKIHVHDLSLPRVFRSRGGFGTHWAYPGNVKVENPLIRTPVSDWVRKFEQYTLQDRHWVTLDRDQLFKLWGALFEEGSFCTINDQENHEQSSDERDIEIVTNWTCGRDAGGKAVAKPDPMIKRWEELQLRLTRN